MFKYHHYCDQSLCQGAEGGEHGRSVFQNGAAGRKSGGREPAGSLPHDSLGEETGGLTPAALAPCRSILKN